MNRTLRDELAANVVLAVGAHADDVDFTAAGTVARLAAEGAAVYYLVLTDGSKGSSDPATDRAALAGQRRREQRRAARALGVREVYFLDYEDGALTVSAPLQCDIVRYIRRLKPEVVLAFDPTMVYYVPDNFINHPDHRACGQAVLDAVYPLARDCLAFPELQAEGLPPHNVCTVLLTNFAAQDYFVDISQSMEAKMAALAAHASQVATMTDELERVRQRARLCGQQIGCPYAEGFVRLDIGAKCV